MDLNNIILIKCLAAAACCKKAGMHMDQTGLNQLCKTNNVYFLIGLQYISFNQFCLITGLDGKTSPSLIFRRDETILLTAPPCHTSCCEPAAVRNYY